jgi:hypothetical protein
MTPVNATSEEGILSLFDRIAERFVKFDNDEMLAEEKKRNVMVMIAEQLDRAQHQMINFGSKGQRRFPKKFRDLSIASKARDFSPPKKNG